MQFTNLKLTGFKSFVDPTEVYIEPGLTGIVGPNGCGKSNLVEALKWVMGESSAKQLRGGEMDDVIFGGSAERPSRNIAEVIIGLDNTTRKAPAAFNESDMLEVSRRIERGSGSNFRINGREVRARDVQLLFADAATGARSTALVSQGQIGAMISAKPAQRRSILEEAAGITGLHSRRHEAELRLRGAEANLERLGDVVIALDGQLQGLKKQARQTARYRNLSGHIRAAEATLLYLRWTVAHDELEHARGYLQKLEAGLAEMTTMAAAATTHQLQAAEGLPEMRKEEAEIGAELQRYAMEKTGLDNEEQRLEKENLNLRNRAAQADGDTMREQVLARDAETALARIESERTALEEACQGEADDQAAAQQQAQALDEEVRLLDERLQVLTEEAVSRTAQQAELERRQAEALRRQSREEARRAELENQLGELQSEVIAPADLAQAEKEAEASEAAVKTARAALDSAEKEQTDLEPISSKANEALQEARAALTRAEAEEQTLAALLENGSATNDQPLLDMLTVEPGFEAALGAALGEDLDAGVDTDSPVHWRIEAYHTAPASLPEGATSLAKRVKGPIFLEQRLSQIGVVDDEEAGQRLCGQLTQGQRLVSRDGGHWRWDGFTVAVGAQTPAATRLEHRNRLAEIRAQMDQIRDQLALAKEAAQKAKEDSDAAAQSQRDARLTLSDKEQQARETRDLANRLRQQAATATSQQESLKQTLAQVEEELALIATEIQEVEQALAKTPDTGQEREELTQLRDQAADRRGAQAAARQAYDSLRREAEQRRQSLKRLDEEEATWKERQEGALGRVAELDARKTETAAELAALAARPDEIAAKRAQLTEAIAEAETRRQATADRLAEAEAKLRDADRALKDIEGELQKAREARVRAEFQVEQGDQTRRSLVERIADRLSCEPDDLWELTGLKDLDDLPDMPSIENRLERLLRERDAMGPVNLRADEEVKGLTEQMDSLSNERQELETAIEKLRRGIAELNKEGRQRLLASFDIVNKHFRDLFVRLYGGGKAHLTLIEAEDPLNAGLEIMAQPPGKKLQSLSLLSGGEQALTATALLFAVFLTNPAPICVLDEVDAPLDDANVDRFCSLVEDISKSNQTRFLVVTHHRMTMARMDRLYGVTMQERGVSKLVSVNLQRAEELRETA